jgi:hypothetical protein
MDFLNALKERIPDYAKDIRLNLDATIGRSSLDLPNSTVGGDVQRANSTGRDLASNQPKARLAYGELVRRRSLSVCPGTY